MRSDVAEAGRRALLHIAETFGGLPQTVTECLELTEAYAVRALPLGDGPAGLRVSRREIPTIVYDPTRCLDSQKCGIVHELVEWILIGDNSNLLDWDELNHYHQDGGSTPSEIRHLAAAHAEWIYSEWLRRQG